MDVDFTDDEIREELARLGYKEVPEDKLAEFKKDLMTLIHVERSKSNSLNSSADEQKLNDFPHHSPVLRTDKEHQIGNFSNHGNQWLRSNYREDWQYRGEDGFVPVTRSATDHSLKSNYPRSYGYKMPFDGGTTRAPEMHEQDDFNNCLSESSVLDGDKRYVKRKTSRKTPAGHRRIDESVSDSEAAGIYEIYEKIKKLAMRDCECGKSRPTSADVQPPYRINGPNKCPSVIFKGEPPHTRNLVRTNRFDRHRMYRQLWKKQPAIGDDVRSQERKAVHAKMLQKDEIKMDRKIFIPNNYVVPTEKPRFKLRWAVRGANERYEMPPHGFYHEA